MTPENFFLLHHEEIKIKTEWAHDKQGSLSLPISPNCAAFKAAPWNCLWNKSRSFGRQVHVTVIPTLLGLDRRLLSLSLQGCHIPKCILWYPKEILHSWENAMQKMVWGTMSLYLRAKQSYFWKVKIEGRQVRLWFLKSNKLVSLCRSLHGSAPLP